MSQNTSNTSILIIEDEIAIAEGLVDLCELNGYNVKHCADGETGLAEALTGQYGLILLDLMLPGIDGFTVCDKIREKDRSVPIIILSAKSARHGSFFMDPSIFTLSRMGSLAISVTERAPVSVILSNSASINVSFSLSDRLSSVSARISWICSMLSAKWTLPSDSPTERRGLSVVMEPPPNSPPQPF